MPWLAFMLAGGWLGYERLGEQLTAHGLAGGQWASESPWMAAVAGALAGAALAWPINRTLSFAFMLFNRGFEMVGGVYTWIVGKLLKLSVLVFVVYGGLWS